MPAVFLMPAVSFGLPNLFPDKLSFLSGEFLSGCSREYGPQVIFPIPD